MMDLLTQNGISISVDSADNVLATRLKAKLASELEAFAREEEQRKADTAKYYALAEERRGHILESKHRTATSGFSQEQLSDQAMRETREFLARGVSDDELRRIFGRTSDSVYAAKIGRNRLLYGALRQMAVDRKIIPV